MDGINSLTGKCHCGNISYKFKTGKKIGDFSIRRCDCTYCTKTGARYISDPEGELEIQIQSNETSQNYQFGTKTASFVVCKNCGGVPVATCEIEGNTYGIVNINTLDEVEHFGRHANVMSYDGEALDDRLSRRQKNWIGNVKFL